jgi:fibronectin-binding autotransporter adhesin
VQPRARSRLGFNRRDASGFAGVVSGSGALTQAGATPFALTGTNTYTGGTTINRGALMINSDTNLGATAEGLRLNGGARSTGASLTMGRSLNIGAAGGLIHTGSWHFTTNGDLSGPGNLLKAGTGSWTLVGNSSGYTGDLVLAGGVMNLNTTLGARVLRVSAASTLRGVGALLGALEVEGRLSPGNPAGLLTVAGSVLSAPGSTVAFDLYDRAVEGAAVRANLLAP